MSALYWINDILMFFIIIIILALYVSIFGDELQLDGTNIHPYHIKRNQKKKEEEKKTGQLWRLVCTIGTVL